MKEISLYLVAFVIVSQTSGLGQQNGLSYSQVLSNILIAQQKQLTGFCNTANDPSRRRILFEFGSAFISDGATLPSNCLQTSAQIDDFRRTAMISTNCFEWGGSNSCLQPKAMAQLRKVIQDTRIREFKFVVRTCSQSNTSDCSKELVNKDWAFRDFNQAMVNWKKTGNRIDRVPINASDLEVVNMEYVGSRAPFMFSFAIPGGSQHHLGLAVDVNKKRCGVGSECEKVLNENHWYRTIRYDPYHFTYLGYPAHLLQSKGLQKVTCPKDMKGRRDFQYWVPYEPNYKEYSNWECVSAP